MQAAEQGSRRVAGLTTFNSYVERAVVVLTVALLVAFCVIVGWEVFSRYVLSSSRLWAEEAARLAFVWSLFLGASIGFRHGEHLTVDVVRLSPGSMPDRVHEWALNILTLAFVAMYAYLGWRMARTGFTRSMLVLPLPIAAGWLAIPVMGALSASFTLERLLVGVKSGGRTFEIREAPPADLTKRWAE